MAEDTVVASGIVTNPERRSGRSTIQGTRLAVDEVLYTIAAGESIEGTASEYRLSPEQVRDAVRYAAGVVRELVPVISDEELDRLAAEAQQRKGHPSEVAD